MTLNKCTSLPRLEMEAGVPLKDMISSGNTGTVSPLQKSN